MSDVLVAEQLTDNLDGVPQYEQSFKEGDTGELQIFLQSNMSQDKIDSLQQEILSKSIILTRDIVQDARVIIILFKKTSNTLTVISELSVENVIGWQLSKTSKTTSSVGTILGVMGLYLLAVILARPKEYSTR